MAHSASTSWPLITNPAIPPKSAYTKTPSAPNSKRRCRGALWRILPAIDVEWGRLVHFLPTKRLVIPSEAEGPAFLFPRVRVQFNPQYSPRRPALPELRKDPITGRWVIISTDRGKRPSDFLRESVLVTGPKNCPFCPG